MSMLNCVTWPALVVLDFTASWNDTCFMNEKHIPQLFCFNMLQQCSNITSKNWINMSPYLDSYLVCLSIYFYWIALEAVSLGSPGWSWIHNLPALTSQVLGLWAKSPLLSLDSYFNKLWQRISFSLFLQQFHKAVQFSTHLLTWVLGKLGKAFFWEY